MIACHFSVGMVAIEAVCCIPALLTKMSMAFQAKAASICIVSMAAGSIRLASKNFTSPAPAAIT